MKFKVEFLGKGRKRPKVPERPPLPLSTSPAARQLALAYWIELRIEAGELRDLADAARLLGVSRARMTQIANLRLLPIAVQECVLAPGFKGSERSLREERVEPPPSTCSVARSEEHVAADRNDQ